jgi:archaellum component FlaC
VRGEEDGVVEGVSYADEDVAHLSVAVERGGGGESVLDSLDDQIDDFEVDLGSFAGVVEGGGCHGGIIREVGEEWNSRRGTKRTLLGLRLET